MKKIYTIVILPPPPLNPPPSSHPPFSSSLPSSNNSPIIAQIELPQNPNISQNIALN